MPVPRRFATRLNRRALLALPGALVGLRAAADGRAEDSGSGRPVAERRSAQLADRLKAELRVRLPEDEAYCERVAALVDEGRLPERLVTATLAWAVAKGRKYPFALFRRALEAKAAKLGLVP